MAFLFIFFAMIFCAPVSAQTMNPLYTLPSVQKTNPQNTGSLANNSADNTLLAASDKGLFRVTGTGVLMPLWTDGRVEQIVRNEWTDENGIKTHEWFFRTSEGILYSNDLSKFELRNNGLAFLTIKKYDGENTTFVQQVQELKDLAINPLAPNEMVTATKDAVYLSRDSGANWKSLGSMSSATPGAKAVAVATMPDGAHVVFMSHPIFGLSYILPDAKKPAWIDVSRGFYMVPSLSSTDEISDIFPLVRTTAEGVHYIELYVSQMYTPRIYKFNWQEKKAESIYVGNEPADSIDGLSSIDNVLLFTRNQTLGSLDVQTLQSPGVPASFENWKNNLAAVPGIVNAAWIPESRSGFSKGVLLNELWLLYPGTINTPYADAANEKKSVYASAYQCRLQSGIDKYKQIIKDNKLNSLVIDMKDDYGLLRYDTNDELVKEKGRVTQYKIDLDHFVSEFKKDDTYLIARIVVFKDRNLSRYAGGKYAVWDATTNTAWQGTKRETEVDEETGETIEKIGYYDEYWVDPYSPEVWEYNVAIAKELVARGFDEVQFDYIRFPTDGLNLYNAQYRWRSPGMDKESALISFLSYARENIDAPIGIDIYGANGWYRSGTRTGQDAELLAEYVDVVCPMFYPSHFEGAFLNYEPYRDRTYRIYYYGTYRNTVLTRNRAIIRPWVQAFRLNVRFDREYYGPDYIQKQIFGVRDSANRGYMYWNNSGDYSNLLPDVGAEDAYTGTAKEASLDFRKPALGTAMKPNFVNEGVSVLDSVLNQQTSELSETQRRRFLPMLSVPFAGQ